MDFAGVGGGGGGKGMKKKLASKRGIAQWEYIFQVGRGGGWGACIK